MVRAQKNSSNGLTIPRPPQFVATVRFPHRARFQCATGVTTLNITRAILLNLLFVAKTSSTATRLLSGIRLKSISLWAVQTGQSASEQLVACTTSVEWTSTNGPSTIVSDSSMSVLPAYVQTSPPRNSLASFWSLTGNNETDVLAILSLVDRSVIDITFESVIQNGETPTALSPTTAMTAGSVYMSYLDGVAGAGKIPATSYNTTF